MSVEDAADVFDVLLAQHGLVKDMFRRVHDAEGDEKGNKVLCWSKTRPLPVI